VSSELRFEGGSVSTVLTLKTSARAKVMRLRVDPRTGAVILTVPRRVSQRRALQWAAGHRDWIEKTLSAIPAPLALGHGSEIPLEGVPHAVDWRPDRSRIARVEDGRILVGGPEETLVPRLQRWLRRQALDVLTRETHEYAAKAGVTVSRVGVGDTVSRWGSCSSAGTIRYSWRLILAPDWVRRATVAHEVAHRVHMDHSPRFHALVEQLFGADPTPARLWLRRNGAALHRIARA
jgi:predicted metal-dependent hydrolase